MDVVWPIEARMEFAEIWRDAADREPVVRAWYEGRIVLRTQAKTLSRHLSEGLWRCTVPPLVFYFSFDTPEIVRVESVRVLT